VSWCQLAEQCHMESLHLECISQLARKLASMREQPTPAPAHASGYGGRGSGYGRRGGRGHTLVTRRYCSGCRSFFKPTASRRGDSCPKRDSVGPTDPYTARLVTTAAEAVEDAMQLQASWAASRFSL